ncbi:MAG: hypothetical protein EDM79_21320, partial [Chloroflexi bacterium]
MHIILRFWFELDCQQIMKAYFNHSSKFGQHALVQAERAADGRFAKKTDMPASPVGRQWHSNKLNHKNRWIGRRKLLVLFRRFAD